MRLWVASIAIGCVAAGLSGPAAAQEVAVHGQIRPRAEVRDLGGDTESATFTAMRVRAGFLAALERGVNVFVQFQDVRIWGEETSTLADFSADNLDLHQGYVQLGFGEDRWLSTTVGRQETNLGGQRLVGAVGWTPQGRSFDGVRVTGERGWGSVDLLAYKLREGDLGDAEDAELLGAYSVLDVSAGSKLDVYALYNGVAEPVDTDQTTFGARLHGSEGRFTYRGELTLQRGQRGGDDVSAHMFGARVGTGFKQGRGAVALWYDYLSGDDDPDDGETKVFDTLFATNHKFYGLADLFLNIPAHTGGLGLTDAAVKGSYGLGNGVRLAVDLHHFTLAKKGSFGSSTLGQELDLTLNYRYTDNLGFTAGHSIIFADDPLQDLRSTGSTGHFGYIMLDARF